MVTENSIIILGIAGYYHDSAAALLVDGEIVAAAHEERFTRKKHDSSFPKEAVEYCLQEAGVPLSRVNHVVFYDKPLIKFERLLETYLVFAPSGVRSFISAAIVWIKEKFLLKGLLKKELKKIDAEYSGEILFSDHHLSHAASAFYPSPFDNAAVLTVDGVGEWSTTAIYQGNRRDLQLLKEIHFPHSIGLLYSAFTYYLGFKVNSGEYKLMGLAPYGNRGSKPVEEYIEKIRHELIYVHPDGSYALNLQYFNYATGLTMTKDHMWEALFGFARKTEEEPLLQHHCDLALAIQIVTEELVLGLVQAAKDATGSDSLVLAGGVALNCVANNRIKAAGIFEHVWAQPASGDAGGALGAALAVWHLYAGKERVVQTPDAMQGSYLGPAFSDLQIGGAIAELGLVATHETDESELMIKTAKRLASGAVVGWFQGRMEWGPRALGARSILGDPRNKEMQKKLNLRIKYREGFRPFAPSVLAERVDEVFTNTDRSPYMLFTTEVLEKLRNPLPAGYEGRALYDKLYFERSSLPAITHIDYSARHQTVHKETNPRYHALITEFHKQTGCPLIINTSFNVRGEPIVCVPKDALYCFMNTDMDYLVIGNFILAKADQTTQLTQQQFAAD